MTPTTLFKIFCLESYKSAHQLKGADAVKSFNQYGVFNYLESFYDVLHTTSQQYLVQEIDQFIDVRKSSMLIDTGDGSAH